MNMQENMMMRFNYIRILLILMLCAGVLSAQGPAVDSLTIIQDTTKSAFPETDSLAAVSLPGDTLKAQTTVEPVPDKPSLPVIEPLLMVLYGGELDSFMYEQVIEEVVFDTVLSSADTALTHVIFIVHFDFLEPVLYTELSKSSDIPVIPVLKLKSVLSVVDSTDTGCLSDLCQQKLAAELEATHVLIWKLSQRRGVLKIAMNLKPVEGKSIGKTAHYYWGEPSEVMRRVRRACWDINNKSYPEELILVESGFQKMWFMTEYYLGTKNTLIGAGALSTGLAVILLQGEEDPSPGIGLPPEWPGE
jgi:hypothetical protein